MDRVIEDLFSTSTRFFDMKAFHSEVLWILIVGFIIALFLSMAVGANDVANSFGTSVGSKVLTLRQACILATIFELAGSALLGSKVSDTIRKGIVDVHEFDNQEKLHMLGQVAALCGSGIWQGLATYLNMPISGSHSTVGAVVGYNLAVNGISGLKGMALVKIVISWFVSPVLSGSVSLAIFLLIRKFILESSNPIRNGLWSVPVFFGFTMFVNILSVTLDGPDFIKVTIEDEAWFEYFFNISVPIIIGLVAAALVYFLMLPRLVKRLDDEKNAKPEPVTISIIDFYPSEKAAEAGNPDNYISTDERDNKFTYNEKNGPALAIEVIAVDGVRPDKLDSNVICINPEALVPAEDGLRIDKEGQMEQTLESDEKPGMHILFSNLQILSAIFGSFAHGGNDVANCIGPLIALWIVYQDGSVDQNGDPPLWILVYGGVGISVGLWVWGRRVIKTMGNDLTKITPASGFTIEIGAAMTVLIASKIGVPVSTTHCKVGSVVAVGHFRAKEKGVDWSLFRNIVLSWVVTVPASAALSALMMVILKAAAT